MHRLNLALPSIRVTCWTVCCLGLLLAAAPAWAERKALVIGNARYSEGVLSNPVHDAEDLAARLRELGFTTTLVTNADKRTMVEKLDAFSNSLRSDDAAVFFFAGHGAQVDGHNYLLPLGANIRKDSDLEFEALDLKRVLASLEPANPGLKLAILDACRNNPYPHSNRSGTRGLARLADAPSGTLVWYATQPNSVADDGSGRNGIFTRHLLEGLRQPGLNVDAVFKWTAKAVTQVTDGKQFPYPEGVTLVDFRFDTASTVASLPTVAPQVAPTPAEPTVVWYRKAAEQGDSDAQNRLGTMYQNGDDVAKDMEQAVAWYRKAAASGNDTAKQNLDKLGETYP